MTRSAARARSASSLLLTGWFVALCLSCGAEPSSLPLGGSPGSAGSGGAAGPPAVNPLGRPRCQAPEGVSGAPRTIEEAIALLNALPKPTGVACFIESLERPFSAYATSSPFSAQPAFSSRSPRVFIQREQLWLSIVLDGESSDLLELSYLLAERQSIKAEVKVPLHEALAPSAPYDRVREGAGTLCGFCHYDERRVTSIDFAEAFASIPFRPRSDSRVSLDGLAADARACDWAVEPRRCDMLSALFDAGGVSEEPFPSTMPTFF